MSCGCENSRGANTFHGLFLTFLLALGGALLGLGIWATIDNAGFNLNFHGWYAAVAKTGVAAIVVGSAAIIISLFGCLLFCRSGKCCGGLTKVVFIFLLILLAAVMILIGVFSILLALGPSGPSWAKTTFRDAWLDTVKNDPSVACGIEKQYSCTGFYSNTNCSTTPQECPQGCSGYNSSSNGCFHALTTQYQKWFIPMACVSLAAAALGIIDLLLMCCIGPIGAEDRYGSRTDYYSRRAKV